MEGEIRSLNLRQSIMSVETKIIQVLRLTLSSMQMMRRHLVNIQTAMSSALNQQLSAHLISADSFHQSLSSLANLANRQGYALLLL